MTEGDSHSRDQSTPLIEGLRSLAPSSPRVMTLEEAADRLVRADKTINWLTRALLAVSSFGLICVAVGIVAIVAIVAGWPIHGSRAAVQLQVTTATCQDVRSTLAEMIEEKFVSLTEALHRQISTQLLEPSRSEVLGKTPHVEQTIAANKTAAESNTQELSEAFGKGEKEQTATDASILAPLHDSSLTVVSYLALLEWLGDDKSLRLACKS